MEQKLDWDEWQKQAKAYFGQLGCEDWVIDTLNWKAFRETYYYDGYTPEDAVREELSHE